MLGDGHSRLPAGDGHFHHCGSSLCRAERRTHRALPAYSGRTCESVPSVEALPKQPPSRTPLQGAIATADRDGLAGWIFHVRGNGGGNMWPMLAGVGPVLGTGRIGHFIDALGAASAWDWDRDGGSWLSGARLRPSIRRTACVRKRPRVAVLIDGGTAGSAKRSRFGIPAASRDAFVRYGYSAVYPRQVSNSRLAMAPF